MAWAYKYRQVPRRRVRKKLDGSWPDEVAPSLVCIPVKMSAIMHSLEYTDWYYPSADETAGEYNCGGCRLILPMPFRLLGVGVAGLLVDGADNLVFDILHAKLFAPTGTLNADIYKMDANGMPIETSILDPSYTHYNSSHGGIFINRNDGIKYSAFFHARDGAFKKTTFDKMDSLNIRCWTANGSTGIIRHVFYLWGLFLEDRP